MPATGTSIAYYAMRLTSQAGQGVFFAGLFLLAGQDGGAALGVSGLLTGMMAAAILFGLAGGALGDRIGPARAVAFGAAGRCLAIILALAVALIPGLHSHFEILAAIAFLYSAASQVYCPAELALASVMGHHQPGRTHAWLVAMQYGGQGAGIAIVAPAAYFAGGVTAMIATAAVIFGGAIALSITIGLATRGWPAVASCRRAFSFGETAQYFVRQPGAAYAGVLLAFGELSTKTMAVALPVYIGQDLGLRDFQVALLAIPAGLAALGGLFWAGRHMHLRLAPQVMRLTLLGTAVAVLALAGLGEVIAGLAEATRSPVGILDDGQPLNLAIAVPVAVLLGLCFGLAPVGGRALLSATAPPGQQSRVFAMQASITDVLAIVPLVLAGIGAELAGARATFAFIGVIGLAVFVVLEGSRLGAAVTVRNPAPGEAA